MKVQQYTSLVAQTVKNLPAVQETLLGSLGWEDPLEKGMAIHCSIHAWRIPWTEEPGGLQSVGSQRAGHGWATDSTTTTCFPEKFTYIKLWVISTKPWASQVALVVKNPPVKAGDTGDTHWIPGSQETHTGSSEGRHGNPLQYSCLENPMDRGAWQATIHGAAKSQTRLSNYT